MTAIRAYEMDLYRRLADGLEAIPGARLYGITDRARFDDRTPTAALTLDGPRAAGDLGGARPRGDRDLGRRLLRHRAHRAARPGRVGRRRPDRADPLQHRRRGRPRRRRPRPDRGGRGGRVTGRSSRARRRDRRRRDRRRGRGRIPRRGRARASRSTNARRSRPPHPGATPASSSTRSIRCSSRSTGSRSRSTASSRRRPTATFALAGRAGRAAPRRLGRAAAAAEVAAAWAAAYPDDRARGRVGRGACATSSRRSRPDVVACRLGDRLSGRAGGGDARVRRRSAETRGATLRVGRRGRPGRPRRRRRSASRSTGSVEPAGAVVVAAGPWTPALVDPSGAWRPIRRALGRRRRQVALAEPAAPRPRGDRDRHRAEPTERSLPRPATAVAFSLVTAGGASSLGSTFLAVEPEPDAFADRLRERGARFVPAIAGAARSAACASCARPLALDGRPLVGAVPAWTACSSPRATGRGASRPGRRRRG